ncbi:MAG TPA: hypothetical protein VFJ68_05390 [Casimicrobiaceae bacterium]|nr:hypothetical protein [Casimicrobiaceae bacterium]
MLDRRGFIRSAARCLLAGPLAAMAQPSKDQDARSQPAANVLAGIARPISVNFPPGRQMHGAMIFPHTSRELGAEQIEWNANFQLEHFTDRLDYLKAMGANCAKILGEVWYVYHGHVSLADYCAQWDQVMAYAKSIGLYVYVCPFTPLTLFDVRLDSVISTVSGLISHMEAQPYADYITCYDIAEEARTFGFPAVQCGAIYNACRLHTSRAMCVSWSGYAAKYDSDFAAYLPYCDFIDVHSYLLGHLPTTEYQVLNAKYPNHDVIIGEWGNEATYSDRERAERTGFFFAAVHNARVKGSFLWCLDDYVPRSRPRDCWGIYHGKPEGMIAPPFSAYHDYMQAWRRGVTTKSGMSAPSAPRFNGRRITWDSPNATDYKTDRLYCDGIRVFEDVFALYDRWNGESGSTWQAATVDQRNVERRGPLITTKRLRSDTPVAPSLI